MRLVLILLLVLVLVPTYSGEERLPLYDGTPGVRVTHVPLDADDPARRTLGPLTYLGGVHFSSRDPAFGGFSAMAVRGDRFLLLADGGLTFAFTMGPDLMPRDYAFGGLPNGPGTGWSKRDRDSESLAIDPATGTLWVGFERANAIWRYSPDLSRATASRRPRDMVRWPSNGGAETLVRLPDGRFLVLSEDRDAPGGGKVALIYDRDPTDPAARAQVFRIILPGDYEPTDAALLPDGRLIVLARAVSLRQRFTAKLLLADPRTMSRGALNPREIATFAAPLVHDNFEGLAITREGTATILWMMSDDNAPSWWQRSLLLKFRLELPRESNAAPTDQSGQRPETCMGKGSKSGLTPPSSRSAS